MFSPRTLRKSAAVRRSAQMPVLQHERQLSELGHRNHWAFRPVGVAPVPDAPLFIGHRRELLAVPFEQERGRIPAHALERMQAIKASGIRVKAFVVVHEAPKELAPPRGTRIVSPREFWTQRIKEISIPVLKGAGLVAATAVMAAAIAIFGVALIATAGLTAAALVVDPYLVAALEIEGDPRGRCLWVVIDSWMTE